MPSEFLVEQLFNIMLEFHKALQGGFILVKLTNSTVALVLFSQIEVLGDVF